MTNENENTERLINKMLSLNICINEIYLGLNGDVINLNNLNASIKGFTFYNFSEHVTDELIVRLTKFWVKSNK